MEPILLTPRLKLTLLTHAERGSEELTWLHALRSDKQTTAWSIHPPSTTLEHTEKITAPYFASPALAYAVHSASNSTFIFIGLITLTPLRPTSLPLPGLGSPPNASDSDSDSDSSTPIVELAYSFLPHAWGRGFATESLTAVLNASRSSPPSPSPSSGQLWQNKIWMRAIVNARNPASLRVLRKLSHLGVEERGVYEWKGEAIFIGGEWRTEDELVIFGGWVGGGE